MRTSRGHHNLAPSLSAPYDVREMDQTLIFARSGVIAATLLASLALVGCGGSDRLKKEVSGLQMELTTLRGDQDRMEERVAALELGASVAHEPTAASNADRVERPRLKVIHLQPDEQQDSTAPADPAPANSPDSTAPRPVIRGTGDRVIKVGDTDGESTLRDGPTTPVADLDKESHGS